MINEEKLRNVLRCLIMEAEIVPISDLHEELDAIFGKANTKETGNGWISIPELGIEVEASVHDKGKCFKDIIIPEGCSLLSIPDFIWIENNRDDIIKSWAMENTENELFLEQPFKRNKKNSRVVVLGVNVNGDFSIYTFGLGGSRSHLGIVFKRELK